MVDIDEVKKKLEIQKKKLLTKERLIKEKEKQKKVRRFTEVGRIASQANINDLDDETLLGAFIEISKRFHDSNALSKWKSLSQEHQAESQKSESVPLTISFKSPPNSEIKAKLKNLNFRWNRFRNEFQGYGNKSAIEEMLKDSEYSIHVVN